MPAHRSPSDATPSLISSAMELEVLGAWLASDAAPDTVMSLAELDGFLTGLIVGPDVIRPSEWLPVIWDGTPEFADATEAEAVLGAIMVRYNVISQGIRRGVVAPIVWADDEMAETMAWATGFAKATDLRAPLWEDLFNDPEAGILFAPIALLSVSTLLDNLDTDLSAEFGVSKDEAKDKVLSAAVETLPECVLDIAAFWRRRSNPMQSPPQPKPGRNAPCPCGSGKKYKKCCGASDRI